MVSRHSLLELLLVGSALLLITLLSNGAVTDWTASLAVFLGFFHAQLSFDLAEEVEESRPTDCATSALSKRVFILKESVWLVTFVFLDSYPLLFGALLFMSYPAWRPWLRAPLNDRPAGPLLSQRREVSGK